MSVFVIDQFTDAPHTLTIEPAGLCPQNQFPFARERWTYQLYCHNTLMFSGSDLETPAGVTEDYVALVAVDFLTLVPEDCDSERFDAYTPAQLAWCAEYGPYLSLCLTQEGNGEVVDLSAYRADTPHTA